MRKGAHTIVVALALAVVAASPVRADRIDDLATQVSSSSNEKVRMSAVSALGRLGDKRALKPLVAALADPSAEIRAVAALALGQLGHKAALPALRNMATEDPDETVRKSARNAAAAVAKANNLPPDGTQHTVSTSGGTAGFGNQPRTLQNRPEVFVTVNSTNDDSPGKNDKAARQVHAEIIKQTLVDSCKHTAAVTLAASEAQRYGLDPRNIDVSVTKMEVSNVTTKDGPMVQVDAELRVAISDGKGRMLSFVSGGAMVQRPKAKFDPKYLPDMRREALENAMRGMFDKLIAHLRGKTTS